MESARAAPPSNLGSLSLTKSSWTKFLKLRRGGGGAVSGVTSDDAEDSIDKMKLSSHLDKLYPEKLSYLERRQQREALESLVANLFASVSAIKAAYAQLQSAQSPYNPDTIQSADQAVVSELKHLSDLKLSYLNNQLHKEHTHISPLTAHLREQESLVKTYEITVRKIQAEAAAREKQLQLLEAELLDLETQTRSLDMQLYPGRTLSALDGLHVSGLNPTHFLAALRCTVKSVRSFVKTMMKEMEMAGWDVSAAARAVHPGVRLLKTSHRRYLLESYVCQKMFSNFHCRDFNLSFLDERCAWDPERFFEEFTAVKSLKTKQLLDGKDAIVRWDGFGKFCRAKYLSVVHPKMEASFFGRLEQRALVSAGPGFPDSAWFSEFAEMARRVWLLHCLFFSFEEDWQMDEEVVSPIFQVKRGARFSEVYMESVAEEGEEERPSTVGFTVVPGFRLEKTLIQCRVYLAEPIPRTELT